MDILRPHIYAMAVKIKATWRCNYGKKRIERGGEDKVEELGVHKDPWNWNGVISLILQFFDPILVKKKKRKINVFVFWNC